jgi:hypothetical protein
MCSALLHERHQGSKVAGRSVVFDSDRLCADRALGNSSPTSARVSPSVHD